MEVDLVVTVKLAKVAPAGMVTVTGTVAKVVLLESETTEPPVGAGLAMLTVPVEFVPPLTVEGLSETEDRVGAVTVRIADLAPAVMVAVVLVVTGVVVMVKVPTDDPGGMVRLAGSWATDVLFELRDTTNPFEGATPLRVTVPKEVDPPATNVGDRLTELTCGGLMVRVAAEVAPYVPEMLALAVVETAEVVTVKVALVRPLVMLTL